MTLTFALEAEAGLTASRHSLDLLAVDVIVMQVSFHCDFIIFNHFLSFTNNRGLDS